VRRTLIAMREDAGLTRQELAHRLGVNPKTVQRWETGEHAPLMSQRIDLARVLDERAAGRTVTLADVHRAIDDDDNGPLNGHRVTRRLGVLVGLEQGAGELWTFETTVMPGLLQTPEYATAVERTAADRPSAKEVARRVALRMRRQHVLHSLTLRALVDASVLWRTTGGPEVMEAQLDHLREQAKRPNVELRVLPLDERAHAGHAGPFTLVISPDEDVPFAVVTFRVTGPQYSEELPTVRAHVELVEHLWRMGHDLAKEQLQRPQ
jgi:DNA-binding XRE family transcriptional regulator